jgi:hypothetical protein
MHATLVTVFEPGSRVPQQRLPFEHSAASSHGIDTPLQLSFVGSSQRYVPNAVFPAGAQQTWLDGSQ